MNKFGLVFSPLCALDSNVLESRKNVQISSLSQTDAEFLFTNNANSLNVLANLTQGEFFGSWLGKLLKPSIRRPKPRPYK